VQLCQVGLTRIPEIDRRCSF